MDIKDELVLHSMTLAVANKIEYNAIGTFQTSDSNTPGYYIVQWTVNAYTLQEIYTFHAYDPPVIIPEGELVFPAKSMTPIGKTSYWYHELYKAIPIVVKFKPGVMSFLELIQDNNTTNKLP